MNSITLILPVFGLLIVSAFFSASETSYSSLNRIKLKNMAAGAGKSGKRAKKALALTENYDKLLSTVLIGNNIVNIMSSSLMTVLFVDLFGAAGVGIATLITTVFVLIVGEISPKTLSKENPEAFALFAAPLLGVCVTLLSPINHLLAVWKALIMRFFKVKSDRSVTEAELLTFVEEVRQEGGINQREEDMIKRTIEFDDLTAREIFTPRVYLVAVNMEDSLQNIDCVFQESGFSRLPVYKGNIDNITGVLLLKDFHHALMRRIGNGAIFGNADSGGDILPSIIKPVVYITESIKIPKLLQILQEKQSHMAVLVDEFGGTRGVITIEDIMEELVGEIWDEHDEVVEEIVETGDRSWKILGRTALKDLFTLFPDMRNTVVARPTTVANWVVETFGGVPKENEGFDFGAENENHLNVTKVKRHRVMEVEVMVKTETDKA